LRALSNSPPIVRIAATSPVVIAGRAAIDSVTAVSLAWSPKISITCGSIRDAHSQHVEPNAAVSSDITITTIFPSRPTKRHTRARAGRGRRAPAGSGFAPGTSDPVMSLRSGNSIGIRGIRRISFIVAVLAAVKM
jgi:hypothetical protein